MAGAVCYLEQTAAAPVGLLSSAAAMGKQKQKQTPAKPPPASSKAKAGHVTPRQKSTLKSDKFYELDDWSQLRPAVRSAFLLACCDQDGWDYDILDVLKMEDDERLSEIQAFASAIDIKFPWADDILTWLEIGDSKAGVQATEEDEKQLQGFVEFFKRKESERKRKIASASPNTRAAHVARSLSSTGVRRSLQKEVEQVRLDQDAEEGSGDEASAKTFSAAEVKALQTEAARNEAKELKKTQKAEEKKRKAEEITREKEQKAKEKAQQEQIAALQAKVLALSAATGGEKKQENSTDKRKKKKQRLEKETNVESDDTDADSDDSEDGDSDGDSESTGADSSAEDSDEALPETKRKKSGKSKVAKTSKQEAEIKMRTSSKFRLDEVYNSIHGRDINKAASISDLFIGLHDKLSTDAMMDPKTEKRARRYTEWLKLTRGDVQMSFDNMVLPIINNSGAVSQAESLFVVKLRQLLRKENKVLRKMDIGSLSHKALEKAVEPFVSSKVLSAAKAVREPGWHTGGRFGGGLGGPPGGPNRMGQQLRMTRSGRGILSCFLCGGNHYQSECSMQVPGTGLVQRPAPVPGAATLPDGAATTPSATPTAAAGQLQNKPKGP